VLRVGRDLAVLVGTERAWQLDLHRLRRRQGIVQARTLTYQCFVPLMRFHLLLMLDSALPAQIRLCRGPRRACATVAG
jgi:hypothetical protein